MKYSSKQITKAGEIVTTSRDKSEVGRAISMINEWRENHLPVIEQLMHALHNFFKSHSVTPVFSSFRLKRMTSIQYKLDLNPTMSLGGMQDIAGGRFVFPSMESLLKAYSVLSNEIPENYEIVKINNYIESPKSSGYRSIHIVYRYHSQTNEDWDNMKVEIQLRTKLQHSWAMAVETAGLVTNTAMKSGQGPDEWQDFFQIVSCLFSLKEKSPMMPAYQGETSVNFMKKLQRIDDKNRFSDQLLALSQSVNVIEKHEYQGDIFLLFIDFNKKQLRILSFDKDERDKASELYNKLENRINDRDNAAVLVSVSSMKELRGAYPSYFLDMGDFNGHLRKYLSIGRVRNRPTK